MIFLRSSHLLVRIHKRYSDPFHQLPISHPCVNKNISVEFSSICFSDSVLIFTYPVWKLHADWCNREIGFRPYTADTSRNSRKFGHIFASIICDTMHFCCSTATKSIEPHWMVPFHRSKSCTNRSVCVHFSASWDCYALHKMNETSLRIPIGNPASMHMADGMNDGTPLHSIQLLLRVVDNRNKTGKYQMFTEFWSHNPNLLDCRCNRFVFILKIRYFREDLPTFSSSSLQTWYLLA